MSGVIVETEEIKRIIHHFALDVQTQMTARFQRKKRELL